ncbi:MAG: CsgG/HfaB family protein [Gemmatimonadota bacterium]|nr:CsgG/HfaB family protein [Gemmatimonadota bacterium]
MKGIGIGTPAVLLGLLLAAPLAAQQSPAETMPGPKTRIAVLDLSGKALELTTSYTPSSSRTTVELPPPDGFARGLTEMLTTALAESEPFIVLERVEIQEVLDEQDFGESGRVNAETAPQLGSVIGAQALITGNITEFTYEKSSVGGDVSILGGLEAGVDRVTAMVALDLRVIDAVTGEVIASIRDEGEASATGANVDVSLEEHRFGTGGTVSTPLGKASRDVIEKVVARLEREMGDRPWSGRIVDVRDGVVYLNAGAAAGIEPGMVFDVYEEAEPLVDPDTGQVLGTPERHAGTIEVTAVEEKYSTARQTGGGEITRDHVIKFRSQGAAP